MRWRDVPELEDESNADSDVSESEGLSFRTEADDVVDNMYIVLIYSFLH